MKKLIMYVLVLLLVSLCGHGISHASLSDGLVAYYPFDGNANDESGYLNHGIVYGATLTADRFGTLDSAFLFSGNDYISIPNSSSISFVDNFTFILWFKNTILAEQVFLSKSGDRTGIGIKGHSDGGIGVENGRCCPVHGIPAGVVNDDKWHLIAVTHGNGMIRSYLDGVLKGEETSSEFNLNPQMANESILVGMGPAGWYFYNGAIDDIRVYNRALSDVEIQELYELEAPSDEADHFTWPVDPENSSNGHYGECQEWGKLSDGCYWLSDVSSEDRKTDWRDVQPFQRHKWRGGFHLGADYNWGRYSNSDEGEPVYPVAKGTIPTGGVKTNQCGFGNIVFVNHDTSFGVYTSMYAHVDWLESGPPIEGSDVSPDNPIAKIGNGYWNNRSCKKQKIGIWPYHLHFELREGDNIENGLAYTTDTVTKGQQGQIDPNEFISIHR